MFKVFLDDDLEVVFLVDEKCLLQDVDQSDKKTRLERRNGNEEKERERESEEDRGRKEGMDRRKKKRGEEKKNDRREMKKSIIFSIRHELIKKERKN